MLSRRRNPDRSGLGGPKGQPALTFLSWIFGRKMGEIACRPGKDRGHLVRPRRGRVSL